MTGAPTPSSRCAACDYDLRGTTSPEGQRCPECGQAITGASAALAREQAFFRRLRRLLLALFVVTALLGIATLAAFRDHALFLTPLLVLLVAPAAPVLVAAYCARRLPD